MPAEDARGHAEPALRERSAASAGPGRARRFPRGGAGRIPPRRWRTKESEYPVTAVEVRRRAEGAQP
ncbi:hypothetical protein, partial [Streptomyces eurythermus]